MKEFTAKLMDRLHLNSLPRVKKLIVAVIGGTVLLIGVALIVLPGPAFLVIPAGLAILATEFVWARRWLRKAREFFEKARNSFKR
ncbi:MAG: putative rane protein [Pedosphaera sp.]|nr:putative rane protein [Pedosphaera sp.]